MFYIKTNKLKKYRKYSLSVSFIVFSNFISLSAFSLSPEVPANRCEISFQDGGCLANTALPLKDGKYYDNVGGSASDMTACVKRVREFYDYCNSKKVVTGKFYKDGQLKKETSFPSR